MKTIKPKIQIDCNDTHCNDCIFIANAAFLRYCSLLTMATKETQILQKDRKGWLRHLKCLEAEEEENFNEG